MTPPTEQTDVVVVGAGMAGLVAAVSAVERGAEPIVLEKGHRAGGSMYLSGGAVWTYDSVEEAQSKVPGGHERLQEIVVGSFEDGLDWLAELGVDLKEIEYTLPGSGKLIEPAEFTSDMVARIEAGGGEVRRRTPMRELVTDEDGTVTGVVVSHDGERETIGADAVVLATGGFQGNEELVQQFVTERTENLWLRANPWSTGDGLEAAKAVGGRPSNGLGYFYGHNLPAPPAQFSPYEFREASQYYGPQTIAVDRDGTRFTDESESELEEVLAQATAKRADGRAYYLLDRDVFESEMVIGTVGTAVERAAEMGGRTCEVESLPALGDRLTDWGVNGEQAIETVRTFNEAIRDDAIHRLPVPRRRFQNPIDTPPFYAVEVQPGITFTVGGLAVTDDMAVVDQHASSSTIDLDYVPEDVAATFTESIDGLFAAGVDVGNVNNRHYLGGLAQALVTGRIAGREAARRSGADRAS